MKSKPVYTLMDEKNFKIEIPEVQENFKKITVKSPEDKDVKFIIQIELTREKNLKFKFSFLELPNSMPFLSVLTITIQDQSFDIFINDEMAPKPYDEKYYTPFKKDILFKNPATISIKMIQIPPYICQLSNNHECMCYMNSSLQLLFHLAKFRSFLFYIHYEDGDDGWMKQLKKLFERMCTYKLDLSTEPLTDAFGWPSIARRIPYDASEFVQIILDRIASSDFLSKKEKKTFQKIFITKIVDKTKETIEESSMINLPIIAKDPHQPSSFMKALEEVMVNKKIAYFPDVLFISSQTKIPYEHLHESLDLSSFAAEETNEQNPNYTLSGIVVRIQKKTVDHYTCYVRAHWTNVWLYFNDTIHVIYPFEYNRTKGRNMMPIESGIRGNIDKWDCRIQLLMYVRNDVMKDYFCYTPTNTRVVTPSKRPNYYNGTSRTIMITRIEDIEKYVKDGYTDFENVGSSLTFELSSKMPYSAVYDYVQEALNVPLNSFVLRTESKTGAPFFHCFENDPNSFLKNFHSQRIHLFYEEVENEIKKNEEYKYIPFYFLYFRFRPAKFIHNIDDNLAHSHSLRRDKYTSTPINQFIARRIKRWKSDSASKIEKEDTEKKENEEKKKLEKNSFVFLKCMVLNTQTNFDEILPDLLELINKHDNANHSKIKLYTAKYDTNGTKKIGYKNIDVSKKICENIEQTVYGTYIYVQCVDDFEDERKFIPTVQSKFLFFKYMKKALGIQLYPREIPYVFMLENFAVPVTFCKLSDHKNKMKTMFVPLGLNLQSMDDLKKIICAAMDEEYPTNGLMQIFFGFKENSPPFHEPSFGKKSVESIMKHLEIIMKTTFFPQRTLSLSGSASQSIDKLDVENQSEEHQEQQEEQEEESDDVETDTEFMERIFIHYHIFPTFNQETEKPVRVYFSNNAITIDSMTQVLVGINASVEEIFYDLPNIFPANFSESDKEIIAKIKEERSIDKTSHSLFAQYFRVLQTSDGKISREIPLDYKTTSNMEVRFERIPNHFKKDEIAGLIPVFYGAVYKTKYSTNYIGSVGTPFYFPVLKSDIENSDNQNILEFKSSSLYKRLKAMITMKGNDYKVKVVNYSGFVHNVEPNELEMILEKKLNYSICIKNLNASTFIDEISFFNADFRLLRDA